MDGEADTIHSDRAFFDNVAVQVRRHLKEKAPGSTFLTTISKDSNPIHVPAHRTESSRLNWLQREDRSELRKDYVIVGM
jgi:hypothetical protein